MVPHGADHMDHAHQASRQAADLIRLSTLTRRELLQLAVDADADPRSVAREIRALRGDGPHVRGRAGERIRAALAARGLLPGGQS